MVNLMATRWIDTASGILIEAVFSSDAGVQFAIRKGEMTLNKEGKWELEPNSNNTPKDFIQRCRWADFSKATVALGYAVAMQKERH